MLFIYGVLFGWALVIAAFFIIKYIVEGEPDEKAIEYHRAQISQIEKRSI